MSYRILRSESVEDAIRRVAHEQVDHAIAASRLRGASEAVHEARKRCKQIRALLRMARPLLGEAYDLENTWYRDAGRELAHLRDAEVLVAAFDGLLEHFDEPVDRKAFAPIRTFLARRRDDARNTLAARRRLREFRERMRAGRSRIESWPLDAADFEAIEGGLVKAYSQGRDRMRAAYASPSAEGIHEWRKRVKDHVHHLQLLRNVWKRPMKARRDEVEALADDLGDDHDLSLLRDALPSGDAEIAAPETMQTILALIGRRQLELRSRAEAIGARVFAEKKRAFARRIERYWDVWRNQPPGAARLGHRPELVSA